MKNKRILFSLGLVVLVVVVVGAGLIINHKSSDKSSSMPATMNMKTSAMTAPVATNAVAISNYMYMPMVIKIKAGTTVTWTNKDQADHSITVDSGSGPNSSLFGKNESYQYTFSQAGTYSYHCDVHPSMHGTVIVTS